MGTFKHYDLRTSLKVAELNTRSSEDLGAKARKIENKLERESRGVSATMSRERVSQSLTCVEWEKWEEWGSYL